MTATLAKRRFPSLHIDSLALRTNWIDGKRRSLRRRPAAYDWLEGDGNEAYHMLADWFGQSMLRRAWKSVSLRRPLFAWSDLTMHHNNGVMGFAV